MFPDPPEVVIRICVELTNVTAPSVDVAVLVKPVPTTVTTVPPVLAP